MKVNFFDVNRQYNNVKEEIEKETIKILESGAYVNGPAVDIFEKEMQNYLKVNYVISNGNGTDALVIALKAINIMPGDEVITTPFSFFSTSEAIKSIGATPVFVDIDETTLNIDADKIEEKINNKTKAILPVHIFGYPANMEKIMTIAKKHNLKVIEDACQAIGAKQNDKMCGTLGDIGCFSFYPTKNLGCCGDGGMLTTNNNELSIIIKALKSHGAGKIGLQAREYLSNEKFELANQNGGSELYDPYKYFNYLIGYNSRLDSLQAGILSIKLKHLEEYNNKRRKTALKYIEEFKNIDGLETLEYNENCCYHQFPVFTKNKEKFINYLSKKGIGTANFYPVPLHLQKAFSMLNYKVGDMPICEKICNSVVCLPIFPELTEEEINYIILQIKNYFKGMGEND
jgi:dTDP-4-amino-4,6-dideoxygalactose transaminase